MEKDVSVFWKWVSKRMDEVGIESFSILEKRSKSSSGSIIKRKNEQKFPTVEMAERMCYALRVDWVEFWSQAGFVKRLGQPVVNPSFSDLQGLDAELYQLLQGTGDDFKLATLKTIRIWLVLYEELRK